MSLRTSNPNKILFLCLCLTPLINIGLDLYTPSLPAIANAFHISSFAVKLTILVYTVSFGIIQPLIGPLCDRHGRRPYLWVALICYFFSSLLASLATNIDYFYLCRIGQAIGAAFIAAIIKAILVDCFEGKRLAKANSYFSLAWSLTPILAPVIGGFLQHRFFWQANFYFMTAFCASCIVLTSLTLPETLKKENKPKERRSIMRIWTMILSDKAFVAGGTIMGIQFALLVIYYISAPFLIQTKLHYNAATYGQIMLLVGGAYLIGNIANRLLLQRLTSRQIILIGLIFSVITTGAMLLIATLHSLSLWAVIIPVFVLFFWDGFIFPNMLTECLQCYKTYPATAGALVGGYLNIVCSVFAFLASHLIDLHQLFGLSVTLTLLTIIALCLFPLTKPQRDIPKS